MVITYQHVRSVPCLSGKSGYCVPGIRTFCERHGLDFQQLRSVGLPEEDLLATGDSMAKRVVEFAHGKL